MNIAGHKSIESGWGDFTVADVLVESSSDEFFLYHFHIATTVEMEKE